MRSRPWGRLAAIVTVLAAAWGFGAAQAAELTGDGGVTSFYTWTGSIEGAPGKLLKTEPAPPAVQLANAANSMRILYTSTDGLDGKGRVLVWPLILPDTTETAPNSPIARALHSSTP